MGGNQAKPIITNDTTNIGFFNISYHWDSFHAQSIGFGFVLCVIIFIFLLLCCGDRFLHYCIPTGCRGGGRVEILPRHRPRATLTPTTPLYTIPTAPEPEVSRCIYDHSAIRALQLQWFSEKAISDFQWNLVLSQYIYFPSSFHCIWPRSSTLFVLFAINRPAIIYPMVKLTMFY